MDEQSESSEESEEEKPPEEDKEEEEGEEGAPPQEKKAEERWVVPSEALIWDRAESWLQGSPVLASPPSWPLADSLARSPTARRRGDIDSEASSALFHGGKAQPRQGWPGRDGGGPSPDMYAQLRSPQKRRPQKGAEAIRGQFQGATAGQARPALRQAVLLPPSGQPPASWSRVSSTPPSHPAALPRC